MHKNVKYQFNSNIMINESHLYEIEFNFIFKQKICFIKTNFFDRTVTTQ